MISESLALECIWAYANLGDKSDAERLEMIRAVLLATDRNEQYLTNLIGDKHEKLAKHG